MPRIIYFNNVYLPENEAFIPLMDRSFLFGDGIYEVSAVVNGMLVDNKAHLTRLNRSLSEIDIPNPHTDYEWNSIQNELISRNQLNEGIVYLQVSRGTCEREFTYPLDIKPNVLLFTQEKNILNSSLVQSGAKVLTVPDQRWERRDIKSVSLLAQVLAKRAAQRAGAHEAWMVEEGFITEGASSTAFIITKNHEIVTRPLSHAILPGVTRQSVMRLASEYNLKLVEQPFSLDDAFNAAEAFYTSASSFVMPVVTIDQRQIGSGLPGALTKNLRNIYIQIVCGYK